VAEVDRSGLTGSIFHSAVNSDEWWNKGKRSNMKTAILEWNGPLIVGQQLLASQSDVDRLSKKGVYLWYRQYTNRHLIAYVGRINNLAKRFKERLAQDCSLQNNPRTPDGEPIGDNSDVRYFDTLMMNFDKSIEIARAEVKLTRFHYVFTTDCKNVEGHLISVLKNSAITTLHKDRRVICCNDRCEPDDIDAARHSFLQLNELQSQRGTLAYILGVAPMPADSCDTCVQEYWVCCECGASSNLGTPDTPPEKCPNDRCNLRRFKHVSRRVCCRTHNHQLGFTCDHCGAGPEESEPPS
jgi:hypothetical protein